MSPRLEGVALDQRAYHVQLARIAAANRERRLRQAVHQLLDDVIDDRGGSNSLVQLTTTTAHAREWSGISRACQREERRLAKLPHGGAR